MRGCPRSRIRLHVNPRRTSRGNHLALAAVAGERSTRRTLQNTYSRRPTATGAGPAEGFHRAHRALPGTAQCSPPVPMRSPRAPLALRKAPPTGPDEPPNTKRKKKPQVTGYVTWGFSEPPVGFEPTTYALQGPARSNRVVPGRAAESFLAWPETGATGKPATQSTSCHPVRSRIAHACRPLRSAPHSLRMPRRRHRPRCLSPSRRRLSKHNTLCSSTGEPHGDSDQLARSM